VLVATGHLGTDEVEALVPAARDAGCRRLLVQHAGFPVPGVPHERLGRLVRAGAVVELTYLSVSPMWRTSTVSASAEIVRQLGGDAVVVASDAGQAHNPSPPEALRSFAQSLHESAAGWEDLRKALADTPRALIEP
jgi:hypothetical protein